VHALLKKASNAEILKKVVAARSRVTYLREIRLDAPKVLEAEQHRVATAVQERVKSNRRLVNLGKN
jgi:hypothetical protein